MLDIRFNALVLANFNKKIIHTLKTSSKFLDGMKGLHQIKITNNNNTIEIDIFI